jgi:hypothetical protein
MLGRLGRFLLVAAVLLAQQTALAHQYWHAAKATVSADGSKAPKGDRLCDLHDLLGTVLGAVHAVVPLAPIFACADARASFIAAAALASSPLTPYSRGPPPRS